MTGKQKKAIAALLSASTVRDAAAAAGISYATLRRWIGNKTYWMPKAGALPPTLDEADI